MVKLRTVAIFLGFIGVGLSNGYRQQQYSQQSQQNSGVHVQFLPQNVEYRGTVQKTVPYQSSARQDYTTPAHRFERQRQLPSDPSAKVFPSDDDNSVRSFSPPRYQQQHNTRPVAPQPSQGRQHGSVTSHQPVSSSNSKPWNQPFPLVQDQGQSSSSSSQPSAPPPPPPSIPSEMQLTPQQQQVLKILYSWEKSREEFEQYLDTIRGRPLQWDQITKESKKIELVRNEEKKQKKAERERIGYKFQKSQQLDGGHFVFSGRDHKNAKPQETFRKVQSFLQCTEQCQHTNEYNPVCGTDGETYSNSAKLQCSKSCGAGRLSSYN